MPQSVIPGSPDLFNGQRLVGALELLQANDVRRLLLEILQQTWHACAYAIQVIGDDFHGSAGFSGCRRNIPSMRFDDPPLKPSPSSP